MKKHKYHVAKNFTVDDGDFRLLEEELRYEQRYEGRAYHKAVVVCDCGNERQAFVTEFGLWARRMIRMWCVALDAPPRGLPLQPKA